MKHKPYISPIEYRAWKNGLIDDPYKYSVRRKRKSNRHKPILIFGLNTK